MTIYAIKKDGKYFAYKDSAEYCFTEVLYEIRFYETWHAAKEDMEFLGHYHIDMVGTEIVKFTEAETNDTESK